MTFASPFPAGIGTYSRGAGTFFTSRAPEPFLFPPVHAAPFTPGPSTGIGTRLRMNPHDPAPRNRTRNAATHNQHMETRASIRDPFPLPTP